MVFVSDLEPSGCQAAPSIGGALQRSMFPVRSSDFDDTSPWSLPGRSSGILRQGDWCLFPRGLRIFLRRRQISPRGRQLSSREVVRSRHEIFGPSRDVEFPDEVVRPSHRVLTYLRRGPQAYERHGLSESETYGGTCRVRCAYTVLYP